MFYPSLTEHDLKTDSPRYSTTWHYNAFAEVVEHTDAKGNSQHPVRSRWAIAATCPDAQGRSQQVLVDQRVVNARGQLSPSAQATMS